MDKPAWKEASMIKKVVLKLNMEEIIIITRRYVKIMFMPMQ